MGITIEDLREHRHEFRTLTNPSMWVYQFEIGGVVFDFRSTHIGDGEAAQENKNALAELDDNTPSEDDEWNVNQVRGEPKMDQSWFETGRDVEEAIVEFVNDRVIL